MFRDVSSRALGSQTHDQDSNHTVRRNISILRILWKKINLNTYAVPFTVIFIEI